MPSLSGFDSITVDDVSVPGIRASEKREVRCGVRVRLDQGGLVPAGVVTAVVVVIVAARRDAECEHHRGQQGEQTPKPEIEAHRETTPSRCHKEKTRNDGLVKAYAVRRLPVGARKRPTQERLLQ